MAGGETGRSLADAAALDVVGKSEVLGGQQEACADHWVCLFRPEPDTPENASCS